MNGFFIGRGMRDERWGNRRLSMMMMMIVVVVVQKGDFFHDDLS